MRIPSDARWEEIDEQFVWKHRLSKSGTREGIMDLETGKTELFELLEFPLVRRELARIAPLNRAIPSVRPRHRQREHRRRRPAISVTHIPTEIARARAEHRERAANGTANSNERKSKKSTG
jgi:hypothetical protein